MSDAIRPRTALTEPRGEAPVELTIARMADGPALVQPAALAGTLRLAALIATALTIVVVLIGLVVSVAFAAAARHWLAFSFSGLPARPAEAASIFLHNLHALTAVGGLLLIAQSPHWAEHTAQPGVFQKMLQRLGEVLLTAAVAANVIVIGASFGAYGDRMVRAALPDGPVELVAYALALALYLQGRQRPLPTRHILIVAALSVVALALAAALETFVNA